VQNTLQSFRPLDSEGDMGRHVPRTLVAAEIWQVYGQAASAVVIMEAYGSAHYRAREMIRFGHEIKLIAPHNGKLFVKRQKKPVLQDRGAATGNACPKSAG
jgi:hypothetical protein